MGWVKFKLSQIYASLLYTVSTESSSALRECHISIKIAKGEVQQDPTLLL